MSEQHPHEFPQDENIFLHNQPTRANDDDQSENVTRQQSAELENFHASFDPFTLNSIPYGQSVNSGTIFNYVPAFQPLDFDPQYHIPAYAGAQPSDMHAPTGLFSSTIPEQSWIDEIHPSYTPASSEILEWAPSEARSHGCLAGAPFTASTGQVVYSNTPTTLPVNQYLSFEIASEAATVAQRLVPDMKPQSPFQQSLSTPPVCAAVKVKNERIKKVLSTPHYEKSDLNGHKPMRISKTKKPEKGVGKVKQEACWRCKRYRKACIGQDVCKECSTAGFRVWPSAIGCRRGAMESFVEKIMPFHSVGVLRGLRVGVTRTSNWRKALYQSVEVPLSPNCTSPADRWNLLKHTVQSTMVFGPDFSALVDVLAYYENSRKAEVPIWTQSILLLSSTCDFYHFFVASPNTEIQLPHLVNATIKFRKSLARSWDMFLKLCLSGRRENWFPAFLTVVLGICSMVILLDAVPSMPGSTRKAIWADVEAIVRDLRVRQYMMSLDLLRIGAKGINPLKLDCWITEEEIDSMGQKIQKRNPKGLALLGHDSFAYDGFIALRNWHASYKAEMLEGNDMWDSVPFTKSNVRAIASLSRVFEF